MKINSDNSASSEPFFGLNGIFDDSGACAKIDLKSLFAFISSSAAI